MDFGRPMLRTPSIVTQSNIRLVPETHLGDHPLDRMVCRSANEAAMDLFLGNDCPALPPPLRRSVGQVDKVDKVGEEGNTKDGKDAKDAKDSSDASGTDGDADVATSAASAADDNETKDSPPPSPQIDLSTLPPLPPLTPLQTSLLHCRHHSPQHLPPPRPTISPGDLVVVFESFHSLNFVYATPHAIFSNRNGHFHHNDFLGKPYGCKIRSRSNDGLGFLYLLRPTPELWTRSLPHRTQIVHELDAAMVVHYLNLSPNMIVCESGTGSGAMSHAILRSVAPKGKLYTYEFNRVRAEKARGEFEGHGLGHLVEVRWRDVCGKKKLFGGLEGGDAGDGGDVDGDVGGDENEVDTIEGEETNTDSDMIEEETKDTTQQTTQQTTQSQHTFPPDDGTGGFLLPPSSAHAIFLDLPEPWLAVPHAAHTLQPTGRIGSYSPCMEQTQKVVESLKRWGFHSIRTVEARLKEYYVEEVELEGVPMDLPCIATEESGSLEKARVVGGAGGTNGSGGDGAVEANGADSSKKVGGNQAEEEIKDKESNKRKQELISDTNKSNKANKVLCARPFPMMRGHTAFLTFATAGNAPQPDPNA